MVKLTFDLMPSTSIHSTRTKRKQGFRVGGTVNETVESEILDKNSFPTKRTIYKNAALQHYLASDLSIDN